MGRLLQLVTCYLMLAPISFFVHPAKTQFVYRLSLKAGGTFLKS